MSIKELTECMTSKKNKNRMEEKNIYIYIKPILTNLLRIHSWPQNFETKIFLLLLYIIGQWVISQSIYSMLGGGLWPQVWPTSVCKLIYHNKQRKNKKENQCACTRAHTHTK